MAVNRDFIEILAAFNAHSVEYILVGAHAMAAHGHVRATKDLDIWVRPSDENAPKVLASLVEFGVPLHDLTEADLATAGTIFQIGVPPIRIDILTEIDGVAFESAWPDRIDVQIGGISVPVLSRHHLMANKRASGRLQDLADLERLEKDEGRRTE